jgi:hypothetical protein
MDLQAAELQPAELTLEDLDDVSGGSGPTESVHPASPRNHYYNYPPTPQATGPTS